MLLLAGDTVASSNFIGFVALLAAILVCCSRRSINISITTPRSDINISITDPRSETPLRLRQTPDRTSDASARAPAAADRSHGGLELPSRPRGTALSGAAGVEQSSRYNTPDRLAASSSHKRAASYSAPSSSGRSGGRDLL